ncbi:MULTISPECIES: glycosyltransferase family 52 [Pectobacterium]|uniref:glycosyltransferase family 52 n=1 Tax=Pectobacterium TaxID=122277 RepID=UPI0005829548|nr:MULTISPECIES: glycosyltransferase family 52 [Pectobacterium]KHS85092.1 hypothetical protein RC84_06135 [Pectobacterium carotovorum subsp. carotovorum]MDE8742018.1 glycosyltransferase family 52 [Pectobacterium polaris]
MNVFLCFTPLQCLIARRVIYQIGGDNQLVYIVDNDNEKSRLYFEKTKKTCINGYYVKLTNNRLINCLSIMKMALRLRKMKIDCVFLASIDNVYMQMFLSYINFNKLYTFDDGLANIYPYGIYYNESKVGFIRRFIFKFISLQFSMGKIKALSARHYTIYPVDIPNIVPKNKLEKVELFDFMDDLGVMQCSEKRVIKIFLGQPIFHNDNNKCIEITNKAISFINPDFYFKHPREKYSIENIQYIHTPLIFEDYIISLLDGGVSLEIYSFYSSCLFNLISIENVKVFSIQCDDFNAEHVYALMSELHIPIIYIR